MGRGRLGWNRLGKRIVNGKMAAEKVVISSLYHVDRFTLPDGFLCGLIECADFYDVRLRFYKVPSLQVLLKTVKAKGILDSLKLL